MLCLPICDGYYYTKVVISGRITDTIIQYLETAFRKLFDTESTHTASNKSEIIKMIQL